MAIPEDQARRELGEQFNNAVTDHPDVMAECLSIIRIYNISPTDLYFKYEAFLLSRPSGLRAKLSTLTLESVRELRREIQREHQAKAVASSASEVIPKATVGMRKGKGAADLGGFLDGLTTPSRPKPKQTPVSRLSNTSNNANLPSTSPSSAFTPTHGSSFATPSKTPMAGASGSSYRPGPSKLAAPNVTPMGRSAPSSPVNGSTDSPSLMTPTAAQPFHLRPQANTLVETLNPHLPSHTPSPITSRSRVGLTATAKPTDFDYRYMFEKISQRSEALDDAIDDFAETIKEAYGLTELGDPHFVSEDSIYTVGRILSPPTDNSKVNAGSLFLESSRLLGAGRRIGLKFRPQGELKVRGGAPGVKGFGLFPGCLVCVKGRNGGGSSFVVEEVLQAPPSALAQTPAEELLHFQHGDKLGGQPISMLVAAGPYTLDDNLEYEPFQALMENVIQEPPDVLILLGPFVDSQHPLIQLGAVTSTPVDLFKDHITSTLQRLHDVSPGTSVILVPSVRDMVSRHVAYPQAMLDKESLGLSKKVRCLPNPCTFSVNEILIAVSSVDVLFHLRKEELFTRAEEAEPSGEPEAKDGMANLVRHVLGQRTFYPLFPPPEAHAGEVNLDVTHYPLLKMDGPAPDILITPSKLKHFSKIVDSTLVINPAHVSRAHSAGTFAKVVIHPTPKRELEKGMQVDGLDEDLREHAVWERARSEIWRV